MDVSDDSRTRADQTSGADLHVRNDSRPGSNHAIIPDYDRSAHGGARRYVYVVTQTAVVLDRAVRVQDARAAGHGPAVDHGAVEHGRAGSELHFFVDHRSGGNKYGRVETEGADLALQVDACWRSIDLPKPNHRRERRVRPENAGKHAVITKIGYPKDEAPILLIGVAKNLPAQLLKQTDQDFGMPSAAHHNDPSHCLTS